MLTQDEADTLMRIEKYLTNPTDIELPPPRKNKNTTLPIQEIINIMKI